MKQTGIKAIICQNQTNGTFCRMLLKRHQSQTMKQTLTTAIICQNPTNITLCPQKRKETPRNQVQRERMHKNMTWKDFPHKEVNLKAFPTGKKGKATTPNTQKSSLNKAKKNHRWHQKCGHSGISKISSSQGIN